MHTRVFDARLIRDQKFGWTFFPPFCSPIFQKQSKLFTFHLFFSSLYLEEYIFLLSHFSSPQKNFWQPRFERLPMTECFIERSLWGYQMKNAAEHWIIWQPTFANISSFTAYQNNFSKNLWRSNAASTLLIAHCTVKSVQNQMYWSRLTRNFAMNCFNFIIACNTLLQHHSPVEFYFVTKNLLTPSRMCSR